MYALLTALVLAQTSVNISVGGKVTDSSKAERSRRADSVRMRNEERMDSLMLHHSSGGDSSDIRRRKARQIALTPALLANAFRDPRAKRLLSAARDARLQDDTTLTGYDATTYERMSVGVGFKRIARNRLLMRAERSAHVMWSKGGPAFVEITGKRAVMPMLEGAGDADMDLDGVAPIPYFPGRETLWIGSGLAKADISSSDMIHPLVRGAEAYYTYATGDSVSFQLPNGKRIQLVELVVRPRAPKWNVALGSLWFDVESSRLVRAVYRMAEPMDVWAVADEEEEDPDDRPPGWVKGMVSPLKAQVNAVTVEYGLHEQRFWMPRVQALEGSAQAGFLHVPFKLEQSFKYASVNGALAKRIPQIAVADTARDSVSRAARLARRRAECKDGGDRTRTVRRNESGLPVIVRTPCDSVALAHSPDLPKSIYDDGEEVFGKADRQALEDLVSKALPLDAQPGWIPQRPVIVYGLSQTRFNKIEGLSTGIAARQSLGMGYTARASARIGVADWQPNAELGLWRSNGRSTIGINGYRRLASANDWTDPFGLGSSLSALLFGRDEGFYYRTAGVELMGTPDDSATTSWRLFAENHSDAETKTSFSVPRVFGKGGFGDNLDSDYGNIVGIAAERHGTYGLDPHGLRLFLSTRAEGAAGSFDYVRGMFDFTASHGLTKRFDGAVTIGAGTSGGELPLQRLWYLGGSQTVRGQSAGAAIGDAFWMGRVEIGSSFVGARPVVFYDAGWAGSRKEWGSQARPISGAGVGASFLDGLVRFDLARGIYPEKKIRANLYVEARF
ncbi:MAG TPA: ShlB/FhaC/HecB family hemolysin secretion/activation protein [Gemmatimonadaceae bacterium]|nr:ShlB/FhaC/HecB family hemolysin secretion/activation protein [Gemmatimonadaceae bacterium]